MQTLKLSHIASEEFDNVAPLAGWVKSDKQYHKILILSLSFDALITIFIRGLNDQYCVIHSQMTKTLVDDKNIPHKVRCKELEKLQHILNDMMNIIDVISVLAHENSLILQKHQKINKQHYPSKPIKNMKHKLQYLTFGYIKIIEHKYDLKITYYLKMICLKFYGNIIMKSKILSTNQTNIIGYSLNSIVTNAKFFAPKLIYDSTNYGFDENLFDLKCKNCNDSLIIMKTNENDIFCMFNRPLNMYGFLLQTSFLTPDAPILHTIKSKTYLYHFPNEFTLNPSEKFADILENLNEQIPAVNRIGSMQKAKINANLFIDQFEVFEL